MEIKGIDVSAWQHADTNKATIDWQLVREADYKFAIVKCTQGLTYTNPWLDADINGARDAGLLVGCYHYAWPTPGGAEAEAKYALDATNKYDLDLGVTLDLETIGDVQFAHELATYAQEFLRLVSLEHEDAPLYTDRSFLTSIGGPVPNHKLWLALGTTDLEQIPVGVHPWCVQTTAAPVRGIVGDVDQDVMMSPRGLNPPAGHKPPAPEPVAVEKAEEKAEPAG